MTHTINATLEIFVCLVLGVVIGLIIYWICSFFCPYAVFVALAGGIGIFCWQLDTMMTMDWDDGEDE